MAKNRPDARGISTATGHRSRKAYNPPLPGGADLERKGVTAAVLGALKLKRIWCWRVNAGTFYGRGGTVKGAAAGTPDIQGVLPEWIWGSRRAVFFEIETKVIGGRLSEAQLEHREKSEAHGVLYGVAESGADAAKLIDRWTTAMGCDRRAHEGNTG